MELRRREARNVRPTYQTNTIYRKTPWTGASDCVKCLFAQPLTHMFSLYACIGCSFYKTQWTSECSDQEYRQQPAASYLKIWMRDFAKDILAGCVRLRKVPVCTAPHRYVRASVMNNFDSYALKPTLPHVVCLYSSLQEHVWYQIMVHFRADVFVTGSQFIHQTPLFRLHCNPCLSRADIIHVQLG